MDTCLIFGVDNYNALGIIRSLAKSNFNIILIAIDSRCNVAYKSRYLSEYYRVTSLEEGYNIIKKYKSDSSNKTYIITNDDKAQDFIDKHKDELKNNFIFFNSNKYSIKDLMDKFKILQIAKDHNFRILPTIVINRDASEIPNNLKYPVITKSISPLAGGWKSDVYICRNKEELLYAITMIKSPQVLIQKFIEKQNEYCLDGFSLNHGKDLFIPLATTYNYLIRGYYSPYMTVQKEIKPSILQRLSKMFKDIGYEGIFSVEFLIDQKGNYYFSEINFRNSTWSYTGSKLGYNIPLDWITGVSNYNQHLINKYKNIKIPDNYTAMVEPIDYQKRVVDRGYSKLKWFKDFIKCNCKFYYDIHDLKPFIHMLKNNKRLR